MRCVQLKNRFYPGICHLLVPKSIIKCETFPDFSGLLRIVSSDFLALSLFYFKMRRHGRQILYFKFYVDDRKFHYRRQQVVHRCSNAIESLWATEYFYQKRFLGKYLLMDFLDEAKVRESGFLSG